MLSVWVGFICPHCHNSLIYMQCVAEGSGYYSLLEREPNVTGSWIVAETTDLHIYPLSDLHFFM